MASVMQAVGAVLGTPSARTALNLTRHDHEQIEVQHTHDLLPLSRTRPLDVELYLFIPRNVGVRADNYPRDEFFQTPVDQLTGRWSPLVDWVALIWWPGRYRRRRVLPS